MNSEMKTEMDKVFGNLLKDYRMKFGYKQSELAEKLGISEKYVSRIENGIGGVRKETLINFMNILGISPNIMYKDFITNPKIKKEIKISEELTTLSEKKLDFLLELIKSLKEL